MLITVAIRTLNRAESLQKTLASLAAMELPPRIAWELVIVNNNCTDQTDQVIACFADRLPIRREFEAQQGQAQARNRSVDAARGDYLIGLDDDMLVASGWLAAYADAFQRWPEAAVFGGPIIPRYALPVPKWITESNGILDIVFSALDFGDKPIPLSTDAGRLPYGGNFALRMMEARAFRSDPTLGLQPGIRLLGEDTDIVLRIFASGGIGFWVPEASAEHCIRPEMQTRNFVVRRFAANGETAAFFGKRMGKKQWTGPPLFLGVPGWQWRQLLRGWAGYQVHRFISPAPIWVRHLADYGFAQGAIRYSLSHVT